MKNRRLTPQEKKKNRYDKDYVLSVEYPHSFRKSLQYCRKAIA